MGVKHEIRHDLSPELLRKAVQKAAQTYCERYQKYQARAEWQGDDKVEVRFNVKGVKLAGRMDLKPDTIGMDMDVPFALRLFKNTALEAIEREVRVWIDRAKRGEL